MADEQDLLDLKAGRVDLVRADFRNADLRDLNFTDRDLSECKFDGCDMSGANAERCTFDRATTTNMRARGTNLSGISAKGTMFFKADLSGANLSGAALSKSSFSGTKLDGADLRGASFRGARFNDGTTFADCIVDDSTDFEDASVTRPMSRDTIFSRYDFERGKLSLRKFSLEKSLLESAVNESVFSASPGHYPMKIYGPTSSLDLDQTADLQRRSNTALTKLIDETIFALRALASTEASSADRGYPGLGHNNPPEGPLTQEELGASISTLEAVKAEAQSDAPNRERLKAFGKRLKDATEKILRWSAMKFDLAAVEFSKEIGKSLGNTNRLVIAWAAVTTNMDKILALLGLGSP